MVVLVGSARASFADDALKRRRREKAKPFVSERRILFVSSEELGEVETASPDEVADLGLALDLVGLIILAVGFDRWPMYAVSLGTKEYEIAVQFMREKISTPTLLFTTSLCSFGQSRLRI